MMTGQESALTALRRRVGFIAAASVTLLIAVVAAQKSPAQPTREELAKDNKLFITLARTALKWDEPTEPARIVEYRQFVAKQKRAFEDQMDLEMASTGMALQTSGAAGAGRKACPLLTRELAMKVSTPAGRSVLEKSKPIEDWVGQASREAGQPVVPGESSCKYGRILLVLNPFARPAQIREAMRTRSAPYKAHEPVAGVGDAAFFEANSSFANLYVWTGAQHFHIQMGAGFDDDAKALRANAIALANAIVTQLR